MDSKTHKARELLSHCNGLYVGMLDEQELRALETLERIGEAKRTYENAAGFLGLSKVRILPEGTDNG